jgi:hypothetical protein
MSLGEGRLPAGSQGTTKQFRNPVAEIATASRQGGIARNDRVCYSIWI